MSESLLPADYPARFATWTKLMDDGHQSAADAHYFEEILPAVLPVVRARSGDIPRYDVLVSLLGFTPETVVLTYHLLQPDALVVLHTPETAALLDVVRDRTGIPLHKFYHEAFLHDDEHVDDIFIAFGKAVARFNLASRLAIEMTGGKKTMGVQLANAVAALRYTANRAIDIVYIDYDRYLPQYRKPEPESSRLLVLPQPPETAMSVFRESKLSAVRELALIRQKTLFTDGLKT